MPFNMFCSNNFKMFFILQSVGGKLEMQLISKRFCCCCCLLSCSFSRLKNPKKLKKAFKNVSLFCSFFYSFIPSFFLSFCLLMKL